LWEKRNAFWPLPYAAPDSDVRLLRLRSQAWLYFFAVLGGLGAKTLISFLDQLAVETALTGAGLVAGSKQDSAPLRIESEDTRRSRSSFMSACSDALSVSTR
jgi:hypothetical protein